MLSLKSSINDMKNNTGYGGRQGGIRHFQVLYQEKERKWVHEQANGKKSSGCSKRSIPSNHTHRENQKQAFQKGHQGERR